MLIIILIILFLLINLLPYIIFILREKIYAISYLKSLPNSDISLIIGFLIGIINSLLLFLFLCTTFKIFKIAGGV